LTTNLYKISDHVKTSSIALPGTGTKKRLSRKSVFTPQSPRELGKSLSFNKSPLGVQSRELSEAIGIGVDLNKVAYETASLFSYEPSDLLFT